MESRNWAPYWLVIGINFMFLPWNRNLFYFFALESESYYPCLGDSVLGPIFSILVYSNFMSKNEHKNNITLHKVNIFKRRCAGFSGRFHGRCKVPCGIFPQFVCISWKFGKSETGCFHIMPGFFIHCLLTRQFKLILQLFFIHFKLAK